MYLGSRMSEADQNAIREIARKKYAHAAIYLARKSGLLRFEYEKQLIDCGADIPGNDHLCLRWRHPRLRRRQTQCMGSTIPFRWTPTLRNAEKALQINKSVPPIR
jgi:hypothetical protein